MGCAGGGGSNKIEETELEKETADIAFKKYNMLRPQLQAAEDFYMDKVKSMDDSQEFKKLADSINVTTGKQFDETGRAITGDMAAQGIDPTSGKFQQTLQSYSNRAGTATADAVNKGQTTLQDNALTGMGNLVAMGEGKSAQAIDGMMDVTNNASAYARQEAATQAQRSANRDGTLAFMAGAGFEATNSDKG